MFSLQMRDIQHPFSLSNIAKVMDVDEKLKSRHEVMIYNSLIKYGRVPRLIFWFNLETKVSMPKT